MWSLLLVTLPTRPNAVRLRIWRALKALGCAALRDGAYLLPANQSAALQTLAEEVLAHGGQAQVLDLAARSEAQRDSILAQFDRTGAYADWQAQGASLLDRLPALAEPEARRQLRSLADALAGVQAIDHYPGAASDQAQATLQALRAALDTCYSPGEPQAGAATGIPPLDRQRYQGRHWATRSRPWVDRLACAWLIRRFIDPQARFSWLPAGSGPVATPRGALGFDYDGARFSHVGALVTFEVLMASFALVGDARLRGLASAVHYLDAGGIPVPEAAGLGQVLAGLRELHADDDALATAAGHVFDALYAAPVPPI